MSIREIARISCQPGKSDECVVALTKALASQAADPECLEVFFERRIENENDFFLHIVWTSKEAHETWRSAHREEFRVHLNDVIDGNPELLGHFEFMGQVKAPTAS